MAIDLTNAQQIMIDTFMTDECEIYQDGRGGVWDPVTGTYTNPANAVLYRGVCQLYNRQFQYREAYPGTARSQEEDWAASLPANTALDLSGDVILKMTKSSDPNELNKEFSVNGQSGGSFQLVRTLNLSRYVRVP